MRKDRREAGRGMTDFRFLLCDDVDELTEQKLKIRSKHKVQYIDCASVFDIEVSSLWKTDGDGKLTDKVGVMYAFVFGINGRIVVGRTWDDFLSIIGTCERKFGLSLEKRLVVYVHNLAYEFQFIRKLFHWDKVFSLNEREPIVAVTTGGIEFRCSYKLTGYSLAKVGEHLHKYKVAKMVGDLDYSLARSPKTPLTPKEWNYVFNDGYVVMAHIQEEIERVGGITHIPMTKTGYVRNETRKGCFYGSSKDAFVRKKTYFNYRALMSSLTLDVETYDQLKRAFQGGFTHASSYWVNSVAHDVVSKDFTSSYPAVMCSEKFPMDRGRSVEVRSMKELDAYLHDYCCLFDIEFVNLREKITTEHPISLSKCWLHDKAVTDNGRVVRAERIGTTITEQDFFVYKAFYEWDDAHIYNFRIFRKAYLPKDLLDKLLEFYEKKTRLKGVEGKEVEYLNSKEMLNAFFGMCVTDICRDTIVYDGNKNEWSKETPDVESTLQRNNKSKKRFLFYAWGVWVTAYARRNLFSAIYELGKDYIYSDTDSVKFVHLENHEEYFAEYNDNIRLKVKNCLTTRGLDVARSHPKTIKGIEKPIGVWDSDGTYRSFKTLGAKRYIDFDDKGLHITIAGVNKESGGKWLMERYKTEKGILDAFRDGLTFPEQASGRKTLYYVDNEQKGTMKDYLGKAYNYDEKTSICMKGSEYTMSMSDEFIAFLNGERGIGIRGDVL